MSHKTFMACLGAMGAGILVFGLVAILLPFGLSVAIGVGTGLISFFILLTG